MSSLRIAGPAGFLLLSKLRETASVPADSAGQTFNTPQTTKEKEDRWLIALILCIVLGGFGVHRFYTGNTTTGIIMLLTLGGCGIWALIDLIMIACNTYVDGNGQTLK